MWSRFAYCVAVAATAAALLSFSQAQPPALYRDPAAPLDRRVDDLLGRLTLEEKVSQLMSDSPAIDRLGIPAYNWWNECLHGVARAGRAKYHEFVRRGKHNIYQGLTFWTPNINLFRDPRWGRGMETYGEDPYLTGA